MTDISPINAGRVSRTDRVKTERVGQAPTRQGDVDVKSPRSGDQVELSSGATLLSKLNRGSPVRADLVARVKQEIANGTYETPEKLETAIDLIKEDLELELNLDD